MTSEPMDADPVSRVQQRFAKLETSLEQDRGRPDAPSAPSTAAPAPAAPVVDTSVFEAAVAGLRARLDQQLDELRHELEGAFDEVCTIVERTARAVDAQHEQVSTVVGKVDALGSVVSRQHQVLAALQERSGVVEVDLTPLLPPLTAIDEKVRVMRADLSRLAHALHTTTDDGVEVDMAYLEEVVRRGAVANAADIANLRTDVEHLTSTLRDQSTSLVEMRKQMEWIRQRLLGR